jgi:hypothetical protein
MAMARFFIANFYIFLLVACFAIVQGLDLKKWSSWLFALYGFITGFLIGYLSQDDWNAPLLVNWKSSLQLGALFAFVVMYAGTMNRWHRKRFENMSSDDE